MTGWRVHVVIKRWPGRPPRARRITPMISLARLACCAYGAQALKRRSVKIHRSQPACRQHQPATEVQHEDHRKALHRKVLQKTPVLAMHQSCVRTDLSTVRRVHSPSRDAEGAPRRVEFAIFKECGKA